MKTILTQMYPELNFPAELALELEDFRQLDYYAVENYQLPIKVIILNNNELGKISKEQRAGEFDVWATGLVNPDFAEYASGCGALGLKVTQKEQLHGAMKELMDYDGPGLLEITTDVELI